MTGVTQEIANKREAAKLHPKIDDPSHGEKIDVLDHGFVRLVDHMGSDLSIARAARVSYDAAWRAGEDEGSDTNLINYLWRNQHSTPFEAVEFQLEVKAPIFVFRQWHRHRTWTYNELSARYRPLPKEFYVPDPQLIGTQSTSSKQARDLGGYTPDREFEVSLVRSQNNTAFDLYHRLLESGWPKELARSHLPLATYSHMFAKIDLLNLFKFLSLRVHKHAQYEIQVYALAILELIKPIASVAVAAWEKSREEQRTVESLREENIELHQMLKNLAQKKGGSNAHR